MSLFEPIFAALNERGVRYLVVGGVATVLHGYPRFTADLDLMVDLERAEAEKVIEVLTGLGFEPRAPVAAAGFAEPETRQSWIRDKNMQVFSMFQPQNPILTLDLFVLNPIEFDEAFGRSQEFEIGAVLARVAALDDLIALKRLANRAQDRADIEQLELIKARRVERSE